MTGRPHTGNVRTDPDIRGLVLYGRCTCGWSGPRHPATSAEVGEAQKRAAHDLREHLDGEA